MKKKLLVLGSAFIIGISLLITVLSSSAVVSPMPEYQHYSDACSINFRGTISVSGIYSLGEATVKIYVMSGSVVLQEYEREVGRSGTFNFSDTKTYAEWGGTPNQVQMEITSIKYNNTFSWILSLAFLVFSIAGTIYVIVKDKKERPNEK